MLAGAGAGDSSGHASNLRLSLLVIVCHMERNAAPNPNLWVNLVSGTGHHGASGTPAGQTHDAMAGRWLATCDLTQVDCSLGFGAGRQSLH